MSRRNQARRRRSYGRRQHDIRERRTTRPAEPGWEGHPTEIDWRLIDLDDDHHHAGGDEGVGGFAR